MGNVVLQSSLYLTLVVLLAWPLGRLLWSVCDGRRTFLSPVLGPIERLVYRLGGIDPGEEMDAKRYLLHVLVFGGVGIVALVAFQALQGLLPLNPQHLGAVRWDLALNTAVSFVTNTNWQAYSGESTMSNLTQMAGLTVQNFLSAAVGLAVLFALIRGFTRTEARTVGNFWADVVRSTLYVLLPLSLVLAVALVSQGVVQSLLPAHAVATLQSGTTQTLPLGPAASQIAIKQLGTNGGGFFGANSAHPFENPTPLSNLLEMASILLLPFAACFAFGYAVRRKRQGLALLAAMLILLVAAAGLVLWAEHAGTPLANLEGKEIRFGATDSSLWAVSTTAASSGSVNAMHDSFTPLGGLVLLVLMQIGEVAGGGVGSGLYGMVMFAVLTVFIAGLMVGRTPEYLGKKIEPYEMRMAVLAVLGPTVMVLLGTAAACVVPGVASWLGNPGPHGFSELLYAFSSAANNNGSAFAGLKSDTPFLNLSLSVAMLVGRYVPIAAALGIAGSLGAKKSVPASAGTLPTHDLLFIGLLVAVILLVGALSFFPSLALGPIVEQLSAAVR